MYTNYINIILNIMIIKFKKLYTVQVKIPAKVSIMIMTHILALINDYFLMCANFYFLSTLVVQL